ncbi:hypothetical protein MKW94_030667 [Papaver nudicaule]|uniref:Uncharacterized protein n=1 Tax=Papaver nudicaule TaxID=74823 RepID=A0AA41VIN5_PAPNU|nr:hypothetical protein [Papaver nudicaule]
MASLQHMVPSTASTLRQSVGCNSSFLHSGVRPALVGLEMRNKKKRSLSSTVVAAVPVGDVTSDGNNFLIAGAIGVALIGTAFPIFFSRKDICPECDGAGFIRKGGATLSANAARKDLPQIVCANCNGLGKLNQIDK